MRLLKLTASIILFILCSAALATAQTITGDITTGGADCSVATRCVVLPLPTTANTIRITVTGTWTGTLQFNWAGAGAFTTETNGFGVVNINPASFAQASTTTANGSFVGVNNNFTHVMVRASTLSSGTASIRIQASANNASTSIIFGSGSGGTIGTVNQGTASLTENWRFNCVSGCSGGTTDTDDGSIAAGQATGISLALGQVFDGTVWRRLTIGTAGTASAQVLTVQGIASMTPLLATLSGTNNISTVTTVTTVGAVTSLTNALPAGTNNIGDVDVLTVPADPFGVNADAASATGSISAKLRFIAATGIPITGNVNVIQGTGTNLHMVCDSGCTSSSLPADNSGFTAGTTGSSPISGFYQSTVSQLTDGRIGAIGLTSYREVKVVPSSNGTPLTLTPDITADCDTGAGTQTCVGYGILLPASGGAVMGGTSTNPILVTLTGTNTITASNLPVNISQINGVTPLMGNGASGTGAIRVTIANDTTGIIALTTSTAQIGHLEANQSVNTAQINGVTPLMGAGNTGTGSARTTEATDSQLSAGVGATGDAAATVGSTGSLNAKNRLMTTQLDAIQTAVQNIDNAFPSTSLPIIACNLDAQINTATSGNVELVSLTGGQIVYVCSYDVSAEATVDVRFVSGTGTACATGETAKSGLWAFSTTTGFLGIAKGSGLGTIFRGASGEAVCIELSAAVQINGSISYAKF